jgi:GMP synthase (glutamine-hydrolysing)
MAILAIQNCEIEGFGRYGRCLEAWGMPFEVVKPYRGEALPPLVGFDAILVGGTPLSAYALHEYPFLRDESDYLAEAVYRGKPCLGICCGAQLLAQALGAQVLPGQEKEIGGYQVRLTEAGAQDEMMAGFPPTFPVFHWHGDTFELPLIAELLVEGQACRNQMFRAGPVVGIQFHLEVGPEEAAAWADEYAEEL